MLHELIERLTWTDQPGARHQLIICNSLFLQGPDSPPNETITYPNRQALRQALNDKRDELEKQGWRVTGRPDHDTYILTKGKERMVSIRIDSNPPPEYTQPLKEWHM